MNHIDPSHHHLPKTSWQSLGQLRLTASSTPDGAIRAWLIKTLSGLNLPGDLVSRLLASMEEATVRALSPDCVEGQDEYLEIVVLVPTEHASKGHTWGFFRVEKATVDSQNEGPNEHCVEYYLYLDRKIGE